MRIRARKWPEPVILVLGNWMRMLSNMTGTKEEQVFSVLTLKRESEIANSSISFLGLRRR